MTEDSNTPPKPDGSTDPGDSNKPGRSRKATGPGRPGGSPPAIPPPEPDPPEEAGGQPLVSGETGKGTDPTGKKVWQPHDSFFKLLMSVPANAASLLSAALPGDLAARLDLSNPRPVPGSFIDDDQRKSFSDEIYEVSFQGKPAYVYAIIEQQTKEDSFMALRVALYVLRFLDQWVREHPDAKRLPPVIAIVMHNGPTPWAGSLRLTDLFNLDGLSPADIAAIDGYLPRHAFQLYDLPSRSVDELLADHTTDQARISFVAFKVGPDNPGAADAIMALIDIARRAAAEHVGTVIMSSLMVYLKNVSKAPKDELRNLAFALGPDVGRDYVTTHDMIVRDAKIDALVDVLLDQLTARFHTLPRTVIDTVRKAPAEQLRVWAVRFADPTLTLDQILA